MGHEGLFGNWKAISGEVFRDWHGRGSCAFSGTIYSTIERNKGSNDDKEPYGTRSIQALSPRKEATMRRRVLDRWIVYWHSWQAWEWNRDRELCKKSWERISQIAWRSATGTLLIPCCLWWGSLVIRFITPQQCMGGTICSWGLTGMVMLTQGWNGHNSIPGAQINEQVFLMIIKGLLEV